MPTEELIAKPRVEALDARAVGGLPGATAGVDDLRACDVPHYECGNELRGVFRADPLGPCRMLRDRVVDDTADRSRRHRPPRRARRHSPSRPRLSLGQLAEYDVLCIDELGYLSYSERAADLFDDLVNRRYEARRPIVIATNLPFASWGQIVPNASCAGAIIERLIHRAIGYVTPRDMLDGRADELARQRQDKLRQARERREAMYREPQQVAA